MAKGYYSKQDKTGYTILNSHNKPILFAHPINGLLVIDYKVPPALTVNAATTQPLTPNLLHQRFGHASADRLNTLVKDLGLSLTVPRGSIDYCTTCITSKQHVKPIDMEEAIRTTHIGQLIDSDVCGPMSTSSVGGARYYVSFTDNYSRRCQYYLENLFLRIYE
jgi:hypothetical protein